MEKDQIIGSHFRIVHHLGRGGMGNVYRCFDESLGREVAIKFLSQIATSNQELADRFLHEGRALATVDHPNVVRIHSSAHDPSTGCPFLVMEYIDGVQFSALKPTLLKEKLRLPGYMLQLCEGIRACHNRGIVHRDLKPSNIMIAKDGQLKIVDFGIARSALKLTKTRMTVGTPLYMSPEQCMGAKDITGKTDVYSIGIIFWEFTFGSVPFEPDSSINAELAVAMQHIQATLPMIAVDANDPLFSLLPLIRRMLDKEPANRPSIDEVILELENFVSRFAQPIASSSSNPHTRLNLKQNENQNVPPSTSSTRFNAIASTLFLGFVIGIGLYLLLPSFRDSEKSPSIPSRLETASSAILPFSGPIASFTVSASVSEMPPQPVTETSREKSAKSVAEIEEALAQFAPSQDPESILQQITALANSGSIEDSDRLRGRFAILLVSTADALADIDPPRQLQFLELANRVASLPELPEMIVKLKILIADQNAKVLNISELEKRITKLLESPIPLSDPKGLLDNIMQLATETGNLILIDEKKVFLVEKLMKDAMDIQPSDPEKALANLRFASSIAPHNENLKLMIESFEQVAKESGKKKREGKTKAGTEGADKKIASPRGRNE